MKHVHFSLIFSEERLDNLIFEFIFILCMIGYAQRQLEKLIHLHLRYIIMQHAATLLAA